MAVLIAVLTSLATPAIAHAAAITVNDLGDGADPTPADGICDNGAGMCTLRAAIQTANQNNDGQDTITVPAGTIVRSTGSATEDAAVSGDLDIAHDPSTPSGQPDLIINGAGMGATIVDARQHDRVFQVLLDANAVITGLTMRGGQPFSDKNFGGGIDADGALTLDGVEITDNHVLGSGCCGAVDENGDGGAGIKTPPVVIKNSVMTNNSSHFGGAVGELDGGTLDVFDSTLSGNTANASSAIGQGGAGVESGSGRLTFTRSVLENNTAGEGGAILADGGASDPNGVFVTDSTIRNNHAVTQNLTVSSTQQVNGTGGGIAEDGTDRVGVVRSTISGNTAQRNGGGFSGAGGAGGPQDPGTAITFDNSTIDGNTATDGGGGLFLAGFQGQSAMFPEGVTLNNVTMSGNSAGVTQTSQRLGAAVAVAPDGQISMCGGPSPGANCVGGNATLTNSIVAGGSPQNCVVAPGKGSVSSGGHNIDSGSTCGFTAGGDMQNTDPKLGPLQNNGGLTATDALLTGSPAIDAAGGCPPPATDQRGVLRPQGPACDIGAFEVAVPAPSQQPQQPTLTPHLPSSCTDTRKFTWVLHHARGQRVVDVKLFVNGVLRLHKSGHNVRRVTIGALPQGAFALRIEALENTGASLISSRTYNGCTKKRPKTRHHGSRHHHHRHG